MLLDYAARQLNVSIWFKFSDIQLYSNNDTSNLTLPEACNRADIYFYLSLVSLNTTKAPTKPPPFIHQVHAVCFKLKIAIVSAAKSKVCTLFTNDKEAVVFRIKLTNMVITSIQQPSTPPPQVSPITL